ncbi:hypothetical protein O181_084498 [Austropuccinia psidii MF-1]|uniref:Tf2-1-like SH3-like domain-containing protein n=1 Tax=Austropuccinia psidii MF-1 TaxID=1389203 RepID=A0A9Q3FVR3_9BASI|nr:hypothetical protein [Austropuccinia psidii MF-1]
MNIISRGGTNHTWNLTLEKGTKYWCLHWLYYLTGPKKMRDSFVGPFTITELIGKNAVEVKLTEEFSRKQPVFPVIFVKPYFQTEEDKLPSRKKNLPPPEIVDVEDSPGPVKKIIKAGKIRLNSKDQRQYLVRFKNQAADKDKWLEEDAVVSIPFFSEGSSS